MKDSGFGAGWHAGSALIGVLSGLALGAMFGMWFGPDVIGVEGVCEGSVVWCFLYTWQTLIAGILATAAAVVGAYFLWVQIQDLRERDRKVVSEKILLHKIRVLTSIDKIFNFIEIAFFEWNRCNYNSSVVSLPIDSVNVIIDSAPYFDEVVGREAFELVRALQRIASVYNSNGRLAAWENISQVLIEDCAFSYWSAGRLRAYCSNYSHSSPAYVESDFTNENFRKAVEIGLLCRCRPDQVDVVRQRLKKEGVRGFSDEVID